MRAINLTSVFLCIAVSQAFAGDSGGMIQLRVYGTTAGQTDSPAEILIVDAQGRRTGFLREAPLDGDTLLNKVEEIPVSMYIRQGLDAPSDEDPVVVDPRGGASYRVLTISDATSGYYNLKLIGVNNGGYQLEGTFQKTDGDITHLNNFNGFVLQGETTTISINYDPAPGAPAPVMTKTVTFDTLRNDVSAARQLNQLGDDKFVRGLIKNIDLAEKLAAVCDKRKREKDKPCEPAANVLKLFVKRLELANHKCDVRNPAPCDEEREWTAFRREHGKDHDYDDFFRDWSRDDWHKDKKTCKRFVSDDALKIISGDAGWLIKSLGGEMDKRHDEPRGDDKKGR